MYLLHGTGQLFKSIISTLKSTEKSKKVKKRHEKVLSKEKHPKSKKAILRFADAPPTHVVGPKIFILGGGILSSDVHKDRQHPHCGRLPTESVRFARFPRVMKWDFARCMDRDGPTPTISGILWS